MAYIEYNTGSVYDQATNALVGRVLNGRFFRLDQLSGNPAVSSIVKPGEKGIPRRQGDDASLSEAVSKAMG